MANTITTEINRIKASIENGTASGVRLKDTVSQRYQKVIADMKDLVNSFGDIEQFDLTNFNSVPGTPYDSGPSDLIEAYTTVANDFKDRHRKFNEYLDSLLNSIKAAEKHFKDVDGQ